MARWFILAGIILIIIGLILYFAPWIVNWFGKLPGDIRIIKENSKIFIPVTSMVLISIIITLLLNLFKYLKK